MAYLNQKVLPTSSSRREPDNQRGSGSSYRAPPERAEDERNGSRGNQAETRRVSDSAYPDQSRQGVDRNARNPTSGNRGQSDRPQDGSRNDRSDRNSSREDRRDGRFNNADVRDETSKEERDAFNADDRASIKIDLRSAKPEEKKDEKRPERPTGPRAQTEGASSARSGYVRDSAMESSNSPGNAGGAQNRGGRSSRPDAGYPQNREVSHACKWKFSFCY